MNTDVSEDISKFIMHYKDMIKRDFYEVNLNQK